VLAYTPKVIRCTSNALRYRNAHLQTAAFHNAMYTNALRDLHQGFSLTMSLNRRQPYPYANENEQDSHGPVDTLTGHPQRQRHCDRIRAP
jgi:hypothetical protein